MLGIAIDLENHLKQGLLSQESFTVDKNELLLASGEREKIVTALEQFFYSTRRNY